ncbi:MAG: hypothetical protein M3264_03095 [Thermoproteota archaeon]|nr:hypothetical protein [Thermoproteota archaeon]
MGHFGVLALIYGYVLYQAIIMIYFYTFFRVLWILRHRRIATLINLSVDDGS